MSPLLKGCCQGTQHTDGRGQDHNCQPAVFMTSNSLEGGVLGGLLGEPTVRFLGYHSLRGEVPLIRPSVSDSLLGSAMRSCPAPASVSPLGRTLGLGPSCSPRGPGQRAGGGRAQGAGGPPQT